eukprot:CAMPEP_0201165138 /NCGR_PEP_ID=MMETSP0851-20130426/62225_1 /ASSEMBLY_ACC=CAM_ASM_000631 /TAXON_ID=183588 /ORGANISM="Pseudo-nitzschia fraudulenta, Strain WWA7" /LENGTH=453 /DNA_ID=CAMNT_0047445713 /DNA_START=73 /DNA_END=1434 /DNA_ORIENTATION=+
MNQFETETSASISKGSRPASASASASALAETIIDPTSPMMEETRRSRSLSRSGGSTSDGKMTVRSSSLSTIPDFSHSLDEETGLRPLPPSIATSFSAALNNEISITSISPMPLSDISRNKTVHQPTKNLASLSPPVIKLKPRLPRRSGASLRSRMDENPSKMCASFKAPSSDIFIPFLSTHPPCSSPQLKQKKQKPSRHKPMSPTPLIPQKSILAPLLPLSSAVTASTTTVSTHRSKIRRDEIDCRPLERTKKTKRSNFVSTSMSPPQLIPTFDFGMYAKTSDAMTPPPPATPIVCPPTVRTTPPSTILQMPLLVRAVDESSCTNSSSSSSSTSTTDTTNSITNTKRTLPRVVARPIAMRPPNTPSLPNTGTSLGTARLVAPFASEEGDCNPHRLFPISSSTNTSTDATSSSSISAPTRSSAFSLSSIFVPISLSSLSSVIPRTLTADDGEKC